MSILFKHKVNWKYAIGKVILIFIGISLAIAFNNWNEYKKDRITEHQILIELKENLDLNVEKLESQIEGKQSSDFSTQVLLTAFENQQPYHDSLAAHFGWGMSYEDPGSLSKAGYEAYKNIGTNILLNKELKSEIIYLFEDTYLNSQTRIDRLMESNIVLTQLRQDNLMRTTGFHYVPFDYNKFIQDQKLHSWLITIRNSRRWGTNALEDSLEETIRVLQLINDELGN